MLQIVAKDLVSPVSNNAPKILGECLLACWVWKPTQMQIPTSMLPSRRNCRVHTECSAQRFCDLALRYLGPVLMLWCGTVAVILDFDMSNTLIFHQHARVCCSNFCCICIIIQDYAIIALYSVPFNHPLLWIFDQLLMSRIPDTTSNLATSKYELIQSCSHMHVIWHHRHRHLCQEIDD